MKWAFGITWILLIANFAVGCTSMSNIGGQYVQLKRMHEIAAANQGQSICYSMYDTNHVIDGWFCLDYWGKSEGDIPHGGGSDEDELDAFSNQLPYPSVYGGRGFGWPMLVPSQGWSLPDPWGRLGGSEEPPEADERDGYY